MGHKGTGGVAKGRDQLHYVLTQEVNPVVLLVGRTLCLTVAPGKQSWREGREGREDQGMKGGHRGDPEKGGDGDLPHVHGNHMVVLAELTQLVAPGKPELQNREVKWLRCSGPPTLPNMDRGTSGNP